ncbi:uncharacterized protein MEPE_04815 [Melanopsichium pennsylvanicum]|uniref:Uncharacterized protein n=1 Tax=Melanopsichium pennsylvanicum TaxID=63383 RepID=A0AAJ4XQI4_9BASI|nr:uncharacterized protein MEPE_04815 [Melanopsichium pennsylvanicum]
MKTVSNRHHDITPSSRSMKQESALSGHESETWDPDRILGGMFFLLEQGKESGARGRARRRHHCALTAVTSVTVHVESMPDSARRSVPFLALLFTNKGEGAIFCKLGGAMQVLGARSIRRRSAVAPLESATWCTDHGRILLRFLFEFYGSSDVTKNKNTAMSSKHDAE